MNITDRIKACRRVGVPLVAIETPDAPAAEQQIAKAVKPEHPIISWSIVRGWSPLNEIAMAVLVEQFDLGEKRGEEYLFDVGAASMKTGNPVEMLVKAKDLPNGSILIMHQAHRYLGDESSNAPANQAAAELRELFKSTQRTLVMLAPVIKMPNELAGDVLTVNEPLPDSAALKVIVDEIAQAAEIEGVDAPKAAEALTGLSAFAAEQACALSVVKNGGGRPKLDTAELWERKRRMISETPALSVYRGPERFDSLGGNVQVKQFLGAVLNGRKRPGAIVFLDEIEKSLGNAKNSINSADTDQLGVLLSYMQDTDATGLIFLGPPGTGKSAVAKCAGNEGGIPTIQLDLGSAKGSLVGQSEQQIRQALKVVTAVSSGQPLFIATSNGIASLPPELRRRFNMGTWFFDLPDQEEREAIWTIYERKYSGMLTGAFIDTSFGQRPSDEGWTGAEIRNCCDIAYRLNSTLEESARFVVPVSIAAKDEIRNLRKEASERYLSANKPGLFQFEETKPSPVPAVDKASRFRRFDKE